MCETKRAMKQYRLASTPVKKQKREQKGSWQHEPEADYQG